MPSIVVHKGKLLFWLCCGLVVLALLRYALHDKNSTRGMRPQGMQAPVRVAEARAQDVPYFLNGIGTVVPSSDVLVKSRVSGQLVRLHFTEGQHVKAGDLLAEIDPRPFQAALAEAKGRLTADMAQLANARRDLARYASLVRGDFLERQKYDTQKALVAQYEGSVAADQAACETARLQLEYSRIVAPAGGIVGLRKVDVGNQISANDSLGLVRICEVSPCDVLFTLPETSVPRVAAIFTSRDERLFAVQAWDREQRHLLAKGRLHSLDNEIDTTTGTVKLKARFENVDRALYPNQFVNARLCVALMHNAVTVPSAAVQIGSKGSYVYVVIEGHVQVRSVTTGVETPQLTVVESGLASGEIVVVDGVDRLREGSAVHITGTTTVPQAETL